MGKYILKRVWYMLLTLFIISSVTFFLMKLLPGSPFSNEEKLSETQREILLDKYGLNEPVPVQYVKYMTALAQGDLGISFQFDGRPVSTLIGERIGASAFLGMQSLILGTILGLVLGTIAAIRHNSWVDYTATVASVLGLSIPSFVFASLLQYYVGVKLQWLPVAFWTTWEHTILPSIALSLVVIATTSRFMRTEILEVLGQDYIITARSKGLSNARVIVTHAIRNAMIPVITILGPLAVNLITGTLIIERIFSVPGLGQQFVTSIATNDYPVIMGTTLFYSVLFIGVILLVDILYGIIDPRIRISGGKE